MLLAPAEYTGPVASTGIESLILRFGAFELDLRNNELRRAGVLIKLSPQSLRVLRFLAENAGRICTREESKEEMWGNEVCVDFDRGLNVCIAQIRSALNDDSEAPRFIQTVPRRGYKFVAPVEQTPTPVAADRPPERSSRSLLPMCIGGPVLVCAGIALWPWRPRPVGRRTVRVSVP